MAALDLANDSYNYFIEVSSARFWFHTDGARRAITSLLSKLDHRTCLSFDEMERYGIPLPDARYGEEFVFLDPGYIFFPHDFHHGLANLWLGLMDPMQRSRLRNPRHRGNHGHLSNFDVENSFVALLDRRYETRNTKGHILDLAPSVLAVLGYDPPPTMNGHPIFRSKSRA